MPRLKPTSFINRTIRDFAAALLVFAMVFLIAMVDGHAATTAGTTTPSFGQPTVANAKTLKAGENQQINPSVAIFRNNTEKQPDVKLVKAQSFRFPTDGTERNRLIVIGTLALIFASMCTLTLGLWRQIRSSISKRPKANLSGGRNADKGY